MTDTPLTKRRAFVSNGSGSEVQPLIQKQRQQVKKKKKYIRMLTGRICQHLLTAGLLKLKFILRPNNHWMLHHQRKEMKKTVNYVTIRVNNHPRADIVFEYS